MSATSSTVDQDAIRVANRYAGQVEKAVTLQERARACQDAAQQYRRDAQANVESVENHRAAARTIRDVSLARQHAMAARDAEAEAAREILAARYYEQQAEQYQAQAHGITPAGPAGTGATGPVLAARREVAGHYDGTEQEKPMTRRTGYNPDQPRAADNLEPSDGPLAATCETGVEHLDAYHGSLEQAVNATPEAADTVFYRPGTTTTTTTTTTTAAAQVGEAAPAGAGELSERDLLARGAYIAASASPQRQRDRAREWDAGRVEADQRAAAYEHADGILADRAQIAAGPGADRMDAVRSNGILRCPPWCPQNDDEHDHEAHIGPGSTFTTEDGDTVTVRPRVSWWPDIEPTVELTVTPAEGGNGTMVLTSAELGRLQELSNEVLGEAEQQHDDGDALATGKPAYPGAYSETVGADYEVDDQAAAAAALDLQSRAGGYYLAEDSDHPADDDSTGPYLNWSSQTEPGVRHFEVGDGTDAIGLTMTTAQLQQLRDGIGRLVGALDDGAEDPGQLSLDDEGDGAYIDWSTVEEDGIRYVEFGDGFEAHVQLELTDAHLRELHARLALQIQLDDQDQDAP